ncbi:MAG: DUF3502 domain-containing protein [Lachnospiraceae bacterium]|nr:DUF3502 domain-containing protein [Lachnospiraceae bacterium]
MKRRWKKLASLGMAALLFGSVLAGCGGDSGTESGNAGGNSGADSTGGGSATGDQEPGGDSEGTESGGDDMAEYFKSKDHYTLKVMAFGDADTATLEKISAELSKITEEKLNCDVELTRIGFASYMTQLNLMLSSGDELDLFVPMASPIDYVNAGQIQPLDELIPAYAPNLNASLEEKDWVTQTFNGEIYGMPVNSEKGQTLGFGMRKDICDELNIDYENLGSFDDLHDALVKVKEAHPDMYPIVSGGGAMFGSDVARIGQDMCGDTYNLAVLEDPFDENGKVVSWYTTDQFRETCEMMYKWAQEGLVMPDASTNTDQANTLVAAGKGFGYFQHMKPGWEGEQSRMNGTETVAWRYGTPTYTGSAIGWFVPTASGDPERAVAFWDMMYSDPVVANLVVNGIEGENYVFADEANQIVKYPEGEDGSSYSRQAWAWPNQQITYFWEGDDTTLWDQYAAFEQEAKTPVSFGFTFDATMVMNEITACTNVAQKYVPALLCGTLDPATTIPTLNEEMEKAGIDKIIAEKQTQLDAWKASR